MTTRRLFIMLSYGLVVALTVTPHASATVLLTETQINDIITKCTTVRSHVQRVEQSDKVLRLNLAQRYDNIARRLMTPMNMRLASNNIDNSQLTKTTDEFTRQLDEFRADYGNYESTLRRLISIDCATDPVGYYNILDEARTQRAMLKDVTDRLNKSAATYQEQLTKATTSLQTGATQ